MGEIDAQATTERLLGQEPTSMPARSRGLLVEPQVQGGQPGRGIINQTQRSTQPSIYQTTAAQRIEAARGFKKKDVDEFFREERQQQKNEESWERGADEEARDVEDSLSSDEELAQVEFCLHNTFCNFRSLRCNLIFGCLGFLVLLFGIMGCSGFTCDCANPNAGRTGRTSCLCNCEPGDDGTSTCDCSSDHGHINETQWRNLNPTYYTTTTSTTSSSSTTATAISRANAFLLLSDSNPPAGRTRRQANGKKTTTFTTSTSKQGEKHDVSTRPMTRKKLVDT
ncbi:unnamed protein product [Amoebophrya sp. A120]|nr:unnamed protein product [Amoebophrya sp. A120]|eukprot:GSA120T00009853001.1